MFEPVEQHVELAGRGSRTRETLFCLGDLVYVVALCRNKVADLKDPGVLLKDPGVLLKDPGVLLKDPGVI